MTIIVTCYGPLSTYTCTYTQVADLCVGDLFYVIAFNEWPDNLWEYPFIAFPKEKVHSIQKFPEK